MTDAFKVLVLTPAGTGDPALAIAASRAGHLGVFNAELPLAPGALEAGLAQLAATAPAGYGLAAPDAQTALAMVGTYAGQAGQERGLGLIVLPAEAAFAGPDAVAAIRAAGVAVLIEAIRWDDRLAGPLASDGIIVKGHEAGGRIGEATSFILLQQALSGGATTVHVRGGLDQQANGNQLGQFNGLDHACPRRCPASTIP